MTTNLPPSLTSLKLSPLFSMRLDVRDVQRIGGQAAAQVGVIAEKDFAVIFQVLARLSGVSQ